MLTLIASLFLIAAEPETVEVPVSITREYLQPFGMPLVASFHKIRENRFLNMHRKQAAGLEALGDFFLIPSRYLFGGYDVAEDGTKTHSFQYDRLDWLKTTCSLISLPVSEVVGSTLKSMAFISRETRKKHRKLRRALQKNRLVRHEESYRAQGIQQFHSDRIATNEGHSRPSKISENHLAELEAMEKICKLLDENGIIYWLDCGTCLGAYRYGGIIPWDDDIDMSILSADHDNVKTLLKSLDPEEFQIQDWSSYKYPKTFLKLYVKKTKTLIDIYHYDLDPKAKTANYFYSYKDSALPESWKKFEQVMTKPVPYDVLFPLKRVSFDGISAWVPNQMEEFLKLKYGKNLSPTMVWSEEKQCYLKVKDHPYWTLSSD